MRVCGCRGRGRCGECAAGGAAPATASTTPARPGRARVTPRRPRCAAPARSGPPRRAPPGEGAGFDAGGEARAGACAAGVAPLPLRASSEAPRAPASPGRRSPAPTVQACRPCEAPPLPSSSAAPSPSAPWARSIATAIPPWLLTVAPWTARRAYPALPPTCREERGACTVRELSLVALRARRAHLGWRQRVCTSPRRPRGESRRTHSLVRGG